MSSCYRTLSLDNDPLHPNFKYPEVPPGADCFYVTYKPEILNARTLHRFGRLGLRLSAAFLFYKQSEYVGMVHSDLIRVDNRWERCTCAVNWNLSSTPSIMNWWECKLPEVWPEEHEANVRGIHILNGVHFGSRLNKVVDYTTLTKIDSAEIIRPTLVRTNLAHNVEVRDGQKERWCLSVRFDPDFNSWEHAVDVLRPLFLKQEIRRFGELDQQSGS